MVSGNKIVHGQKWGNFYTTKGELRSFYKKGIHLKDCQEREGLNLLSPGEERPEVPKVPL